MDEASMIGLLRWILIFLLVYYGFKFFFRVFRPILSKVLLNQFFKNHAKEDDQKNRKGKRGGLDSELGDYVDFEEVKE